MKGLQLLIMIVLVAPNIVAYSINTTITVDWIGNDMFYIRTEEVDLLFNSTDQSDSSFVLNISRFDTNLTDIQHINLLLSDINDSCAYSNLKQNITDSIVLELNSNWSRCNLDKLALKSEVTNYDSILTNKSVELEKCNNVIQDKDNLLQQQVANYNLLVISNNNCTSEIQVAKSQASNNTVQGLLIGGGIIIAIWVMKNIQERRHLRPKEMRDQGYTIVR